MRLATVRTTDDRTRAARAEGDRFVLLPCSDVGELLAQRGWMDLIAGFRQSVAAEDVARAAPVLHPNKIICLGLNYATHIAVMPTDTPVPHFVRRRRRGRPVTADLPSGRPAGRDPG